MPSGASGGGEYDGLHLGLCGGDPYPFAENETHDIRCMLPPICDKNSNKSSFGYEVEKQSMVIPYGENADYPYNRVEQYRTEDTVPVYHIKFAIKCNGYEL